MAQLGLAIYPLDNLPADLPGVVPEWTEVGDEDGSGDATEDPVPPAAGAGKKKIVGLRVNTSQCTGKNAQDLFAATAKHLGWREIRTGVRPSVAGGLVLRKVPPSIYCIMQTAELVGLLPLPPKCWATRYLGCPDLCDKGNFARMVWLCQDVVPEGTFDFNPPTWLLPDQEADLKNAMAKVEDRLKTVIVKPEDGSQGDGIFLAQNVRDLEMKMSCKSTKSAVAQRYLDKPLLLQGFKFDFRVYVVLIGGSDTTPPRTFICKEGLARFCTEQYEAPANKNLHKCMGHLTNYSLNKRSELFEHSGVTIDEVYSINTCSSKRPLTVALRQILQEFPDFDVADFYEQLSVLVRTSCALFAPCLSHAGRDRHGSPDGEMRCCQVLGFDVILDHKRRPYLLEVNNSPSLAIDEALALEPEEAAGHVNQKRSSYLFTEKAQSEEAVCRCMDMHQPHRHRTSMVDLAIKQSVIAGAFKLLQCFNKVGLNAEGEVPEDFFEVAVNSDPVYGFLAKVKALMRRGGGPSKAFSSAGLRRALQPLCGRGTLSKTDLDIMAVKFRQTSFNSRDTAVKPEALRIFDYVQVLRQVSAKAFPHDFPQAAVQLALAELGV